MGADVTVKYLGDPEEEQELKARIKKILSEKKGDWRVSMLGDQKNTSWELKVDGPEGKRWLKKLDGAGAHSVDAIVSEIESIIKPSIKD